MKLWIAEKPDMGRKIAKALGGGRESKGQIIISNNEIVTWAIGHLLEDFMPHEYDSKYKKWNMNDLPILPKRFLNKPQKGKETQLELVSGLVKKAKSIVIATDAGREGESIAWKILDHAGWSGNTLRLWTSSLGEEHLKKAVRQLIDDKDKKSLYTAAKLRSAMDWSDGINLSRAYNIRLTKYGDKPLSLGRVQTATLAILVEKDNEIENFKPTKFYNIKATLNTSAGPIELLHSRAENNRILDKEKAILLCNGLEGKSVLLKVIKKAVKTSPPNPYSLPDLQMAASSKWGWGAKKTLDVIQKLYEKGAITYPRTDSSFLTDDMKSIMPAHLKALQKIEAYKDIINFKPVIRNALFNNAKVEDHHAIITTDEFKNINNFSDDEKKAFDIIAKRFIMSLMPDAEGFKTEISAVINKNIFKTSGTIIKIKGWKSVLEKEGHKDTENLLPAVNNGENAEINKITAIEMHTKCPAYYTEGTLLKAMINAGSRSKNKEEKKLLSGGGLGTQATRQEIIEKLKYRDFAEIKNKKIISTLRARDFISIIREDGGRLADVQATADLERNLKEVEKNPSNMPSIWHNYTKQLKNEINHMRNNPPKRMLKSYNNINKGAA